ncbi:MAG: hypothetical protein C0624_11700 [Desulfuromonas sp.]|nr:MAG: hypothetical protein C0624_11700 [Desulfuromonas sp.]
MDISRRWFCTCTGKKVELEFVPGRDEGDTGEPACRYCGATPSSDPKKTIMFKDEEDWEN